VVGQFQLTRLLELLPYPVSLGRIKALFDETDKYRSSFLRQLSPRAPTLGHAFQLDFREILQKWS